MCGRYVAATPPDELAAQFLATPVGDLGPPRWNVAPTDPVPAVCTDREGVRQLGLLRWGLLPSFVKDPSSAAKRINARGETVATSPAFRAAFERRRCLLPADGFYEWDADRRPWFIHRADGLPLAMAGIWETWRGPGEARARTCAVITGPANADVAPLHDRCPVIVDAADYDIWLDRSVPGSALVGLLQPPPDGLLVRDPASRRVNSVRNDGPDLLDPAEVGAHQGPVDPGSIDGPVPLRLL